MWWGSPDTYRTTEYTADVRPGGRWRAGGVGADGSAFSVEGEFRDARSAARRMRPDVARRVGRKQRDGHHVQRSSPSKAAHASR